MMHIVYNLLFVSMTNSSSLPVFRPSQWFLSRENLAVVLVYFLPMFLLTVLVAVGHEVTFGATFEHSLNEDTRTISTKAA